MGDKPLVVLGLDIGSNSVGSAWIDRGAKQIAMAVSVFPRGVEQRDEKRGAPKNQKRRQARSQRKTVARRSARKRKAKARLRESGLLPADGAQWDHDPTAKTPWQLRAEGLQRELTPHEFGRILVHLGQRRGAWGIRVESEDEKQEDSRKRTRAKGKQDSKRNDKDEASDEEGKIAKAIGHTEVEMKRRGFATFGELMAHLYHERGGEPGSRFRTAIRNRKELLSLHPEHAFVADRDLLRNEFRILWDKQESFGGRLAGLLRKDKELRRELDDPTKSGIWQHRGLLFGQRCTFWRPRTLGRCDLEPSEHRCARADMYAQEFRVLETVNSIRVEAADRKVPLNDEERKAVIDALRREEKANATTVRDVLTRSRNGAKGRCRFTFEEKDPSRDVNCDWFYGQIVLTAFTEARWEGMSRRERESVNRAILKFDPTSEQDANRLREGAQKWWHLSSECAEKLIEGWRTRPKLRPPIRLSRGALLNILPYMREQDLKTGRWPSEIEARQLFAQDPNNGATPEQRVRYAHTITPEVRSLLEDRLGAERLKRLLRLRSTTKADRRYLKKHPLSLPPAPFLANPVVRKAIHQVRRHLNAYLQRFGRKPDRVLVELVKEARQSAKVRNEITARNRRREKIKKAIIKQHNLGGLPISSREAAVERVLLCRQQRYVCPYTRLLEEKKGTCAYTGNVIDEGIAAKGIGVQMDHIVPKSLSRDSYLSNKVVCLSGANMGKGQKTPRDWLTPDQFRAMKRRFAHLRGKRSEGDYFTKKECARKWENLNRKTPTVEEFEASQLTDTAYAAKQVARWLRGVLFEGEVDGQRRVYPTNGGYTRDLRRDWQLQEKEGPKPRDDHRHHAIDAVVIALSGPEIVSELRCLTAGQEQLIDNVGQWQKREPVKPPPRWESVAEFRAQVMEAADGLLVSHRPVKRKVVGALHKETAFGESPEYRGLYVFTMPARQLKPAHLRPPKKKVKAGKETWGIPGSGKGGGKGAVVRSPHLTRAIRACLRRNKKDPDNFTNADIKELTRPDDYKLCHRSGRPIYRLRMVRAFKDPVKITGKDGVLRFYEGEKNSHMEILEDVKTGKWSGKCWRMFDVARRVRPPRRLNSLPMVIGRELDRLRAEGNLASDLEKLYPGKNLERFYRGKRFVMSLCEGEMLYMKSPPMKRTRVKDVDFFVVAKINGTKVSLVHHSDARPAQGRKNPKTGQKDSARETIAIPVSKLRDCGPEPGKPPQKVRVDPLGNVVVLQND